MILQALADYYRRKCDDPDPNERLAPAGFETKEIPFILELDREGHLIQIEDTRETQGKKKVGRTYLVPQGIKKSVNIEANLLWGNAEYVLGVTDEMKFEDKRSKGKGADYNRRLTEMHDRFVEKIAALAPQGQGDLGIAAVQAFLRSLDLSALKNDQYWDEIRKNPNFTFRLQGDAGLVCQRPAVTMALKEANAAINADGYCLVSGEMDEIERLHPPIKGVMGAQTSGANIVSVNDGESPAFRSFGKSQGYNSPVGKRAAFAYTTALNHLLRWNSQQRVQVGDASTVFWAEKRDPLETGIVDIFGDPRKDDPDRNVRAVKSLYKSANTGGFVTDADDTRFYVLGLAAPSKARLTIRFWHVSTVSELAKNIRRHFDDLAIVHALHEPEFLSLSRLLRAIANQGEAKNILPNVATDTMKNILAGTPYPQTLLAAAVRRCRAEQAKKDERTGNPSQNVTYPRAALIKAYLNRQTRLSKDEKELSMSLDESNTNIGYRLGRLFAALERIQQDAFGGTTKINATIRDRYYGSASSTPVAVFPTLLRLSQHHMAMLRKEKPGLYVERDKLVSQILSDGIDGNRGFPSTLLIEEQGRFAIGYYHQRQAFFSKS